VSESASNKGSFGNGFFLGLGLAVVQGFLTFVLLVATDSHQVVTIGIRFFGLLQLIYMVPLCLFHRRRQLYTAAGLATAACFIAVLSISCAGTMW
jgi:hypothetical protein